MRDESSHNPLAAMLAHQNCIISDGGMGTLLEAYIGAPLDSKLWSAGCLRTHPSAIKAVHRQYFEAGADIATAATYQASLEGFMSSAGVRVTRAQAEDLIRKGVALAIEARDEFWAAYSREEAGKRKTEEAGGGTRQRPLVAASVGCYGAAQADGSEYRGAYGLTVEELMDWHRPRLAILGETDADLLAFETIPCQAEVVAILQLLREGREQEGSAPTSRRTPCWITLACQDATHLNSGESLVSCVQLVKALDTGSRPQVVGLGVNCCAPQHVEGALTVLREGLLTISAAKEVISAAKGSERILIAYPNSGEVWQDKRWLPGTGVCPSSRDFADLARKWVVAGARVLGGCCRTTPETIKALRACLLAK